MKTLAKLRLEVDKIDKNIIKQLAHRKNLSLKIAALKKKSHQKVYDASRENQLSLYHESLSKTYGLQSFFTRRLFKVILDYSKKLQKKKTCP